MKKIMVIQKDRLFKQNYFEGFKSQKEVNFLETISKNYQYILRDLAEYDPNFKQPIAYGVIVNPEKKKIFVYQRTNKHSETRLKSKYSIGIGGHIEKNDASENPILKSLLRELDEEVYLQGKFEAEVLGYINYDTDSVGQVHFGILYLIKTKILEIKPKASEIANGKFIDLNELELICLNNDVEEWTRISLEPIKRFLKWN